MPTCGIVATKRSTENERTIYKNGSAQPIGKRKTNLILEVSISTVARVNHPNFKGTLLYPFSGKFSSRYEFPSALNSMVIYVQIASSLENHPKFQKLL